MKVKIHIDDDGYSMRPAREGDDNVSDISRAEWLAYRVFSWVKLKVHKRLHRLAEEARAA